MADTKKTREEQIQQDMRDLHKLGYAQQLFREMGGFSNFAISFSIISILTGAILLYGFGLKFAGPIINTVGWPLVSLFVMIIAASMAEIASAYPTAGGLYFWAFKLGGVRWAWATAWFNMIGQITITSGINIAAAIYIVGAVTKIFGLTASTNWYFYILIMILIMIPQVLINIFGIKLTAKLSDISVYWHIGGVLIIAFLLTVFGKTHNSFDFAMQFVKTVSPYDASSATLANGTVAPALWMGNPITLETLFVIPSPLLAIFPFLVPLYKAAPLALVFAIALLQAQWTYTGFDASAHVAEETVMARLNSAWGVFLSVAVSAVVGYLVLMVLTLSITDIAKTSTDAYPVLKIAYDNLTPFLANIIAVIIAGAMWLCGLSSITSMSRMFFAFARDGGMPGYSLIKQIHPTLRTPVNSIVITSILAVLMLLWSGAFWIVTAISVVFLYWAYVIPVYLNLRNKMRKQGEYTTPETAPWSLKGWGPLLNVISIVWAVLITIFLVIPPNELVLWTAVLICLFMFIYWQVDVKKRFTGPKPTAEAELRRIESEMTAAAKSGDD